MRPAPNTRRARGGFTLVELLVVITIIAILISLIGAGVFKALETAHKTQLRNEISELNKAVIAVQTEYNVKYIPSAIRLRENMNYGTSDQLDIDSWNFLHAMWPRLALNSQIDWNGDGSIDGPGGNAQNGWVLEGEECLVFFTGGIPAAGSPSNVLGFSPNPSNPAAAVTGGARKGPYFSFQSNRLIPSPSAQATGFLRYGDPMTGAPYAYFSSFSYWTKNSSGVPTANRYGTSDCVSLNVTPYADKLPATGSIPHYLNNDTFQIISAGANGKFGQGSSGVTAAIWTPAVAGQTGATTSADGDVKGGVDDMANFYDSLLGVAQ